MQTPVLVVAPPGLLSTTVHPVTNVLVTGGERVVFRIVVLSDDVVTVENASSEQEAVPS